jgi:alpha-glucuronidase
VLTLRAIPDMRPELENIAPTAQANGSAGTRDYREYAPVDYIAIGPDGAITPQ